MKVTYLYHSGFLIEWERCCFLFDYIQGELPPESLKKPFFVFCSHSHQDHFTPEIFRMFRDKPDTLFVMAKQIDLRKVRLDKWGVPEWQQQRIVQLSPNKRVKYADAQGQLVEISTLSSTDLGVAFLLRYEGKTVYHAGDLNDWQWKGESEGWNRDMHNRFLKQMEKLREVEIDLAFAPLDPRQEELAACGINTLLRTARVKQLLPMHMWEKYDICRWWKADGGAPEFADRLLTVEKEGQQWEL